MDDGKAAGRQGQRAAKMCLTAATVGGRVTMMDVAVTEATRRDNNGG
jgi:hypothetical protein